MAVKLVVFDMAGTTVSDDSHVAKAVKKAFHENGIEISLEDFKPIRGYHKPLAIQMLLEQSGTKYDTAFIEKIHDDFETEMIDFYKHSPDVKPAANAEDVFGELKQLGIRISLNTGFSRDIADTIVSRFQWKQKGLIDDLIGSDEVEKGRPWPFMIGRLMQRGGITNPMEVAKIGDTPVDILEGKNAGCLYVVGITTGTTPKEELEKMNPTHIINNLREFTPILKWRGTGSI